MLLLPMMIMAAGPTSLLGLQRQALLKVVYSPWGLRFLGHPEREDKKKKKKQQKEKKKAVSFGQSDLTQAPHK